MNDKSDPRALEKVIDEAYLRGQTKKITAQHGEIGMLSLMSHHIDDNNIGVVLDYLRANPQIIAVDLMDNDLGPPSARELAKLKSLTWLHVGSNPRLGAEGAQALATLPRLIELDMHRCNIGKAGAQALTALTNLRALNVISNGLNDEAVSDFPRAFPNLADLRIDNNHLTSDGVETLRALKLKYFGASKQTARPADYRETTQNEISSARTPAA